MDWRRSTHEGEVTVYPRHEILDPQGKAIGAALARRLRGVEDVRAGKEFFIEIAGTDARAAESEARRCARSCSPTRWSRTTP